MGTKASYYAVLISFDIMSYVFITFGKALIHDLN